MVLQVEPVHVDMDYKTDVEGLWAIGKITSTGSCYFGWTRGDGLGNGTTTAIMAAPSLVEYTEQHDFEDLQIDQIPVFDMEHGNDPVFLRHSHRLEDLAVLEPHPPVIGGEHLDGIDPKLRKLRDLGKAFRRETGVIHMDSVIDNLDL